MGSNNQITSDGTWTYNYNADGDLISQTGSGGSILYAWDNLDRLTGITWENSAGTTTQTAEYTYNQQNRRIGKVITSYSGGVGTVTVNEQYLYDQNGNLIATLNGATGQVEQRFLTGLGQNQILAQENAAGGSAAGPVLWALTNNVGSVTAVVDNGAGHAILDSIVYDSFGTPDAMLRPTPYPPDPKWED